VGGLTSGAAIACDMTGRTRPLLLGLRFQLCHCAFICGLSYRFLTPQLASLEIDTRLSAISEPDTMANNCTEVMTPIPVKQVCALFAMKTVN
jgi:hypothetical protein